MNFHSEEMNFTMRCIHYLRDNFPAQCERQQQKFYFNLANTVIVKSQDLKKLHRNEFLFSVDVTACQFKLCQYFLLTMFIIPYCSSLPKLVINLFIYEHQRLIKIKSSTFRTLFVPQGMNKAPEVDPSNSLSGPLCSFKQQLTCHKFDQIHLSIFIKPRIFQTFHFSTKVQN